MDVTSLPEVKQEDWAAILLVHTWEYSKPQADAELFADHISNKEKLIVLTTSGEGTYTLENVDGISSASALKDIPEKAEEIVSRITRIIESKPKSNTMETIAQYEVKQISWPEKTFIIKRDQVAFDKLSDFFKTNYDAIYGSLQKAGIEATEAPCAVYYAIDEDKQETDLAAAVPVPATAPEVQPFEKLVIPPSTVITTTHYGSYENMHPAYNALEKYLQEHELKRTLMMEQYFSDPLMEKDTSKWKTDIYFIVE